MKRTWLSRDIAAPGPHLTLCLSEEQYHKALADCQEPAVDGWITTPQANATCHYITNASGLICIVCLRQGDRRDGVQIAGLLVHEAVHIWQNYAEYIGEEHPAREQEAYAIQSISRFLTVC